MQQLPERVSTAVYREGMLNASADVVAIIPSKDYVGHALRAVIAKVQPPLPRNAEEFILAPYQRQGTTRVFCYKTMCIMKTMYS